jgi:hypothetical protein
LFDAWPENPHDDLVPAIAVAVCIEEEAATKRLWMRV